MKRSSSFLLAVAVSAIAIAATIVFASGSVSAENACGGTCYTCSEWGTEQSNQCIKWSKDGRCLERPIVKCCKRAPVRCCSQGGDPAQPPMCRR
ncbi:MAG: hypothetical protein V1723_00365 [Candidatus Uhrbacteria bacterium]